MATTYLTRTASANNNSVGKWTFSCWIKRNAISVETNIISFYTDGNNRSALRFDSDDKLRFYEVVSGSTVVTKLTNRLFRDPTAWYHIMLAVDKTLGSPETQIYINGVEETSFATDDGYTQDQAGNFNQAIPIFINAESAGSGVQGICLSHVHFVDGTQYSPTTFGSTDSTTGIWKINTNPSVTYGTNGFFILKDGNSVTDQSGQSNNLTVGGGTLTKSEDCPSNVFATFNPLVWENRNIALTNGNGTATNTDTANWQAKYAMSTLAMSAGKYYAEFKVGNIGTNQLYVAGVIAEPESQNINSSIGSFGLGLYSPGKIFNLGSEAQTSLGAIVADDIIGVAFDVTNGTLQFYKNGSTIGSQITSIATAGKLWRFGVNGYDGTWVMHSNFGNGYFGTTAVSSAGTNASGNGIFEYDVPTGYTALSTKGLNE